jgi:glycerol-3-phosphate dehydrogenase
LFDIMIIGGGIVGCLVGRELSRYQLTLVLVEQHSDVADGTTKANSAIVHAGFDAQPGSLKARFNVAGNARYEALCRDLDVPFRRNGSLVLAFTPAELPALHDLLDRGRSNGVEGLELLSGAQVRVREPQLSEQVIEALYAPSGGIVSPWEVAIAAAENAVDHGMELRLDSPVEHLLRIPGGWRATTAGGRELEARVVINCAGLQSDRIHNLVAEPSFKIHYRRGEYFVLDRSAGQLVQATIFQCPSEQGKGVLISPTVHGNLIVGPNAEQVASPDALETTTAGLESVRQAALRSCANIPFQAVITSFSGLRPTPSTHDFIIGPVPGAPGFLDVAGIESPGLTAAPAIAEHVAELVREALGGLVPRPFNPRRRPMIRFAELSSAGKAACVRADPRFGRVVCRCERITEGEIVDAIHRSAGATTLDGIKRRLRPGMGRCQGGFCGPRVVEILARELGVPMTAIRKDGPDSVLLTGETKRETKRETKSETKSEMKGVPA